MVAKKTQPLIDTELMAAIRKVRGSKSQAEFAEELGTSRPRVNAWENGEKPPSELLLKIGSLFDIDEEQVEFFFKKAGVDAKRFRQAVQASYLKKKEKSSPGDVILLPLRYFDDGGLAGPKGLSLALPATRVAHLEAPFCLEVPENARWGAAGDLIIVDPTVTDPGNLIGKLAVVAFPTEAFEYSDRPISRKASQELLKRSEIAHVDQSRITAEAKRTQGEPSRESLLRSALGTRLQLGHIELTPIVDDWGGRDKTLWRLALRSLSLPNKSGAGVGEIAISDWQSGSVPDPNKYPEDAEKFESLVRSGIEILGRVIGWIGR